MNEESMARGDSSLSPKSRLVASVAGLASLTLVLAACAGPAGDGDSQSSEQQGTTSEIKNAGFIVHAQNGEPQSLDPARAEQGEKGERFIQRLRATSRCWD